MKNLLLVSLFTTLSIANAGASDYVPECLEQARKAVSKATKISVRKLEFYNAGLIGDGVNAVEAITLIQKDTQGLHVINMQYDDCSVLLGPVFLSN